MTYTSQTGKTSQFLVILIAVLLLLLIIFGLSKLIPKGALQSSTQASPSPAPTQQDSSQSPASNYTNSDYGFSFTLPDENWQAQENIAPPLPGRLFFIGFAPKDQSDPSVILEIKDQPVDQVIKNFRAEVRESNNKITLEREVRLGKQYVKQIAVRNSSNNTISYFRFAPKDNRTYIISGQDQKILDNFSFTTPASSP